MTRILVVDDEPQILRALRINLRARRYDVEVAATGTAALKAAAAPPRPTWSCSTSACPTSTASRSSGACAAGPRCRSSCCPAGPAARTRSTPSTPAPTTTSPSRSASTNCWPASAPSPGASPRRRPTGEPRCCGSAGTPSTSPTARSPRDDGARSQLTPTEWELLEKLLRHPGKLVSQRQLLHEVWGPEYQHETHYLRQYMAQLRRKLEDDPARPRHLITEPGMGYRFRP